MSYANKWQINANYAPTGQAVTIYIQERDYSGSIIPLETGNTPISISYTPIGKYGANPWWNISTSTCTISFYDDESGKLSEILSGDDEQFKVQAYLGGDIDWSGFISQDSYQYRLYQNYTNTIRATDRIDQLYSIGYTKADNTLYTGRATVLEILSRCLDSTGLDLGFATHMNWYPHLGTNDLAVTDDMLVKLRDDQDNFFDDDDNPYSKGDVLEQMLMRYQLRLFQTESRWMVVQRKRSITEVSGSEVFSCFHYTSAAEADSPTTKNYKAYQDVAFNSTGVNQVIAGSVTGTIPIGKASIIYYHKNPFENLIHNLSFEKSMRQSTDGTPRINGAGQASGFETTLDGFTGVQFLVEGLTFTVDGDDTLYSVSENQNSSISGTITLKHDPKRNGSPADDALVTFYDDKGNWLNASGNFTLALQGQATDDDDVQALQIPVDYGVAAGLSYDTYIRQTSTGNVAGGTGLRLRTGWWIKVPGITNVTTGFKHAFKMYVVGTSTTWYYRHSDTSWQTTDTLNEVELITFSPAPENWFEIPITSAEMLDGSTPITGELVIEFWEGKEIDPGSGLQQVFEYFLDNVVHPQIILPDGTTSNEATQTLLTYEGNVNRSEPSVPTLITGDGPTAGHIARLTVIDSLDNEIDLTSNWSFLPSVANSGFSLDQFAANQWIREFGRTNKKVNGTIWSSASSDPPKPYHQYRFRSANSELVDIFDWMTTLRHNMSSHDKVIETTFLQFQETLVADQLCTVDIKPNTALLAGVDLNEGLVCGDTEDFTPNLTPTYVYFSGGTSYKRVRILDSGDWTSELLFNVPNSGRLVDVIKVDEAKGYIFGLEYDSTNSSQKWLMRYNLDGSGETQLVHYPLSEDWTASGFTIGRISKNIFFIDQRVAVNGFRVRSFDYEGNVVDALIHNETDGSARGAGIGISSDETYLFFRSDVTGNDDLIRHTLSSGSETDLGEPTDAPGGAFDLNPAGTLIDADYSEGIFTNYSQTLRRRTYPDGTGETLVTNKPTRQDIAMDRANQVIYYVDGATNSQLNRINYDGTGDTLVFDEGSGIETLDLGFN